MGSFLKSRSLYVLFLLPLLVAGMVVGGGYLPRALPASGEGYGALTEEMSPAWTVGLGAVSLLAMAYVVAFMVNGYKLIEQRTALPALLYVLLAGGAALPSGVDACVLATGVLVLAVVRLQGAIRQQGCNSPLFDFGMLVALAVLIYPQFCLLLVWVLLAVLFSGRSGVKDVSALLLGALTPLLFVAVYALWTERIPDYLYVSWQGLAVRSAVYALSPGAWGALGGLGLLALLVLGHISTKYSLMPVNQRRGMSAVISLFCFQVLTFVVYPVSYRDFLLALACPLSVLYSYYFITARTSWWSTALFLLFFATCFLPRFV